MVWPPTCWVGWAPSAGLLSALASFMPSLKPFTAPPRSWPTLRSFLVPKISMTMTRTISQCQMEKLPMVCLLDAFQHGADRVRTAHDMRVQLRHFLLPHTTGIDNDPKTIRAALRHRNVVRLGEDFAQHLRILDSRRRQRGDVLFRNHQHMHRPSGINVLEGEDILIFVHLGRRDFPCNDLAEKAVVAHLWPRAAFSSIPEIQIGRASCRERV